MILPLEVKDRSLMQLNKIGEFRISEHAVEHRGLLQVCPNGLCQTDSSCSKRMILNAGVTD